jgi:DNA-nicking Smr family endonuclease
MHDDTENDDSFREAMRDVRPLSHDRADPHRPLPAPIPQQTLADERQVLVDLLSDLFEPADLETGPEVAFARPGLQQRVLRKLRRGHYSLQSELDLHGLTVPLAREAVADFLAHCRRHQLRCVRIVHGKGRRSTNKGPVLKVKVEHWLRQRDEVMAFCSARPLDGGTGAMYVLLKHR